MRIVATDVLGGVEPAGVDLLVGRRRERRLLDSLIDSADAGGAAVVILGEAGMGKTSLLEWVRTHATRRGARVLTVRGVESEAVVPFAAIADLLLPLREHIEVLPHTQRETVQVCLALAAGPAHGTLAACIGALGVLTAAAEKCPLVIVVDDFQWVDSESAQILLYVARRLATEHIVMVLAVRDEPDAAVSVTGLPTLRLAGLSYAECAELVRRKKITVTRPALTSLVEWTGGNPLALVDRLGVVDGDGSSGERWEGPGSGDLHASLEATWGRLLDEVPDETRVALFVVAADRGTAGRCTVDALTALGLSLQSLAAAERLGLLSCTNGEIRLRHPLLRSVVLARTPLASKVAAFRALAGAADGYQRTWYLAAAATGPDEVVASALLTAAGDAREQNGFGASAQSLRRAAELTADRPARAERLLLAAGDAHLAGESRTAVTWCEEALRYRDDPTFAVEVERVAGRARTWIGEPARGFEGMVRAAARVRPLDAARAAQILAEATATVAMQGHIHLVRQVAEQVEEIWTDSPEAGAAATPTVLAMVAKAFVMSGELHRAEPYLRRAMEALPASNLVIELQGVAFLAQSLDWAERYPQARQHLTAVLDAGRRMASPSILTLALGVSAEIGWWTGHWATAYADATEALQWSEEHAHPALIGYSLGLLARIEAARGEREACEMHIERIREEVEPLGVSCLPVHNSGELGLAALGAGDPLSAIDRLEPAWELSRQKGMGNPNVIPLAGDLAEALARAGQADRCRQVASWLDERATATGLAYPRSASYRARGILAADADEAQRWFADSSASLATIGPIPFEEARTLLCRGEALRRARRPAAARAPLHRALATFDGLGARPWSARARAELAASGADPRRAASAGSRSEPLDELSPQELQVARAAGRGLNNLEVAAALFVSRKTVEAHLTRVYRKLGVRSRTELARVLLGMGITD